MLGNERGILEFRNLGVAQEENRKQRDMRRELVDRRDRVARQGRARRGRVFRADHCPNSFDSHACPYMQPMSAHVQLGY
jgi:hypothetical protein